MEEIKEIETGRVRGYLDLDSYFEQRLGREFIDNEDLFANGLIDLEQGGRTSLFWILDEEGNKLALFKEPLNYDGYEGYGELISEEVSKLFGMPTAHYDLASYRGIKGILSYNFLKEYDSYYSGFDVLADFYEQKLQKDKELSELYGIDYYKDDLDSATDKLNNLEDIWGILEDKYKDYPDKQYIVKRIMDGLVDKLVFDILMINEDDHCSNWGQVDDLEKGKVLAPQFDNSSILNLYKNIYTEKFASGKDIEDKELRLTVDNKGITKPLEVLSQFLGVSDSEYTDLVRDRVNILKENVEKIPTIIELRTEHEMPDYVKRYFITTMNTHLDKVSEVVETKGKSVK